MKNFLLLIVVLVLFTGCGKPDQSVTIEQGGVKITVDRETVEKFDVEKFRREQQEQHERDMQNMETLNQQSLENMKKQPF